MFLKDCAPWILSINGFISKIRMLLERADQTRANFNLSEFDEIKYLQLH